MLPLHGTLVFLSHLHSLGIGFLMCRSVRCVCWQNMCMHMCMHMCVQCVQTGCMRCDVVFQCVVSFNWGLYTCDHSTFKLDFSSRTALQRTDPVLVSPGTLADAEP